MDPAAINSSRPRQEGTEGECRREKKMSLTCVLSLSRGKPMYCDSLFYVIAFPFISIPQQRIEEGDEEKKRGTDVAGGR